MPINSPIEHLAKSLHLGEWRESIFVMLTPYFDASHSGQNDGVMVVSGWLSSVERWLQFETDWRLVLAKFDVPYFHMKEFAHSVEAFAVGWKGQDAKRELFIRALLAVIKDHVMASFSCLIENCIFEQVNHEYQVREYFGNEYALCGRVCIAEVGKWMRPRGYEQAAEFVFEDGDPRGRLTWLMESQGYPAPLYRPSRDRIAKDGTIIRGLLPLQAADFAAYELRKGWDDFGDTDEVWCYRKSFIGIGQVASGQGSWSKLSADDLRETCPGLKVPLR